MHRRLFALPVLLALCAGALAAPRPFNLPPSADLHYVIKARQKGISLGGESRVAWRAGEGKYSLVSESRAAILGRILDSRSEGAIDSHGLAPAQFVEKRYRKDPTTATFDRAAKSLSFADGEKTYPLNGGEQDRASAQWQLAALARAQPEKFTPGSEWKFFVAGRRDGETWTFKVQKREKLKTGLGEIETVHLTKAPPADGRDQQVDLWLAPGHEWYPVQLRVAEDDGEYVEQTVDRIDLK